MKILKTLRWKELFAKVGLSHAEVIVVNPRAKYVILCDANYVSAKMLNDLGGTLEAEGIRAVVVMVHDIDRAFRFVEIKHDDTDE